MSDAHKTWNDLRFPVEKDCYNCKYDYRNCAKNRSARCFVVPDKWNNVTKEENSYTDRPSEWVWDQKREFHRNRCKHAS